MFRTLRDSKFKVKIAGRCIGNYSFNHIYDDDSDPDGREAYISTFTRYFTFTFYLIYSIFALGILERGIIGILSNFIAVEWYLFYYSFTRHGLLLITAGSLFLAVESLLPGISSDNSIFSKKWFGQDAEKRIQAVTILGAALISIGAALQFIVTFTQFNRYESSTVLIISTLFLIGLVNLYIISAGYEDEEIAEFFIQWIKTDIDPKEIIHRGIRKILNRRGIVILFLFATFDIFGSALFPGEIFANGPIRSYIEPFIRNISPNITFSLSLLLLVLSAYVLALAVEMFTHPTNSIRSIVSNIVTKSGFVKYSRIFISGVLVILYHLLANYLSFPALSFAIEAIQSSEQITSVFILLVVIFVVSLILPSVLLLVPYSVSFFNMTLLEATHYTWKLTFGYKRSIFYLYILSILA